MLYSGELQLRTKLGTLVIEFYSGSEMEQFFDECCRMKAFKHPNVVELSGMCLDSPDGFPLMILPLYPIMETVKHTYRNGEGFLHS